MTATVFFMTAAAALPAQTTLTFDSIPATVEEFIILRDTMGTTPEGGAVLTVIAMLRFADDPVAGMTFFTVMLVNDGSQHRGTAKGGYKGLEPSAGNQMMINKLADAPWLARSYVTGATPENGYALPAAPWTITIMRRADSDQPDGSVKLFVVSSGADTPRPIRLKKNDKGIWKIAEFSSLFVGVKNPAKAGDDL
jgi:hypothetical protein